MTSLDLGNHLEGHRIGEAIRSLEIKLQELTEDLLQQKKENQRLEEINEQLRAQLENRDKEIQELKAENEMLKGNIKKLEARLAKDSHNSNKPPSSDGLKKPNPKSRKEKSNRTTGGQKGHKGRTLEQVAKPDFIENHEVNCCEHCHYSLEEETADDYEKRQEFEIPPIKMEVTEHRGEIKKCPHCGFVNRAKFPLHITQPVQYGSNVKAIATYFSQNHLLPFERLQEVFHDIFGISLSEGTLFNAISTMYEKLSNFAKKVKQQLMLSELVHFDESGIRVKKSLHWLHNASTAKLTYYIIHEKRGTEAMNEIGILPEFKGYAVHDNWKPYYDYSCKHVLCNAHHLRELTYHAEQYEQKWCKKMEELLLRILDEVEKGKIVGGTLLSLEKLECFTKEFGLILEEGLEEIPRLQEQPNTTKKRGKKKQHPSKNLWDRMFKQQKELLTFMHDFTVPFTNNQGERDIRMIKVKQKISGCFRSTKGADIFCRIRSYISTARKHELNILHILKDAFAGKPFIPATTTSTINTS